MDHLPRPHNLAVSPPNLVFPLRCNPNRFDDGPLETYPERRGFHLNYWSEEKYSNILSLPDGSRPDASQSTQLLQEWLFFGLLAVIHSTYGTNFDGHDYVKIANGTQVLSLENLPQHVTTWYKLEGQKDRSVRKHDFRSIEQHLMRATRFLTNNFTAETFGSIGDSGNLENIVLEDARIAVEADLDILVLVLLEAIELINKTIWFRERRDWGGPGAYIVTLSMHQVMSALNWCPSELSFVGLTFDNGSFAFASRIARRGSRLQHYQCTVSKCHASVLEVSSYRTAHTTTCRGCEIVHIDSTALESALLDLDHKYMPRIKISITEGNQVNVCLVNEGEYIAISHVWSDGLGHPPDINALPQCQIRRLHGLVLAAGLREPIVWIDTLCVPAKNGPGKRNALARMVSVYRNATSVLVLDSDLLSTPSTCCNEELLLRIALCKWMRRIWTLEEGVVARSKLLFQFCDRAIALPIPKKSISDNIALNCMDLISQYLPATPDILSVITALHFRSTSWKADEPLCIGYVLDLDVSTIIGIDDMHQRMMELYRLLCRKDPKFPWQFLFTDEEKLTGFPFRWAPASLLDLEPHDVFYLQGLHDNGDNHTEAYQTDRGLQFRPRHSCLLSFAEGANIKKCMILRIDALSYVLCPVPRGGKCRSHARFWEGDDKKKCLNVDPACDRTETWRHQYDYRPTGNWGLICSEGGGRYGIMVTIEELKDKVLYASLIGQVHMYELQTEYSSIVAADNKELWGMLGSRDLDEEKVREEQDRVEREAFDEEQYSFVNCDRRFAEDVTWCVG